MDFILKREKDEAIRFLWLQSLRARQIMKHYGIPEETDSIVFIENRVTHLRSSAALKISSYLKWPWKWLVILKIIPRPLRDSVYNFIARHRKRIMGSTSCALPIGKEHRFFNSA
ncbi:MAG: DUF393 domain-containing protein [Flavobacteriales bacterium]|nr:DUF393 domain-containing protein [Flavobacteriales bacterium]